MSPMAADRKVARAPEAVRIVLHYANAKPTESTWRRIVVQPFRHLVLAPGAEPPETPAMGVRSCSELTRTLDEFRELLARWVNLESGYSLDAQDLVRLTVERSGIELKGWDLHPESGRLVEEWRTKRAIFSEVLYGQLIHALRDVAYRSFKRCEMCGRFFRTVDTGSEVLLQDVLEPRYGPPIPSTQSRID